MKCAVHAEVDATGFCRNCGKPLCATCVRPVRDVLYCEDCLAQVVGLPAQAVAVETGVAGQIPAGAPAPASPGRGASSPALAFLLGFVPGLGAIYNGEYNKALIHIVIFAGLIVGLNSDFGEGIGGLFVAAVAIFPFYMAIDALRVAKAKSTGEQLQDPFESWNKNLPVGPAILIGIGVLILLHNFGVLEFFRIRQFFWPLVLIGVGFLMLRNRVGKQG